MQKVRHGLFGLFVVGCAAGLSQALGFRPANSSLALALFLFGLASPFGLLIWSAVCLESEKTLTRIALAMVFVFMLALCYVVAK